jgi:glycosyltransferase involved in cell wall biosynthesis
MTIDKAWAPATVCIFDSHLPAFKAATPEAEIISKSDKNERKMGGPETPPENLISVCVTVFNYGRFLTDCLDSIKRQTHVPLDLVIVDDCSDMDDSVDVAFKWATENRDRFYRVRVHSHRRNQGPSEARNTAFRLASGEFVFIIDADNEIYPRAIARLYEAAVSGSFEATYSQIEKFGDHQAIGEADIWDIDAMRRNNYVDIMALVKREAWRKIDGFTHIEEGWEDYDFWLKFIDAGFSAAYVPEILSRYRVHGKSRTATEAYAAHENLRVIMAFRHRDFKIGSDETEDSIASDEDLELDDPSAGTAADEAPVTSGILLDEELDRSDE